jgi:2-haloacid dehalogenase/putative hydrolase of the HAD superfamily
MARAPRYDIVTFDCYGTLIDWERGIRDAFAAATQAEGVLLDPEAALVAYAEIEPVVQGEAYQRYRSVLTDAACRVAAKLGWRLDPERAGFLAESLPTWPPFPDTNPALARLAAAGYALGILSNVDDDLLGATRRRFETSFELVVTAQQVCAYKPAYAHFQTAHARIGARRWLHAAQSYFHDVVPARALGIPVAWINRKGERSTDGAPPDREFRTLTELANWLTP